MSEASQGKRGGAHFAKTGEAQRNYIPSGGQETEVFLRAALEARLDAEAKSVLAGQPAMPGHDVASAARHMSAAVAPGDFESEPDRTADLFSRPSETIDSDRTADLAQARSPKLVIDAEADPATQRSAIAVSDDASTTASDSDVNRSAALMSVLVIVSRITGFLRTWAQAYGMGTTVIASAFTVANNLPNQLYELVMGGMLVTAFLPVYVSAKKRAGKKGAIAYASNLLSLVTILMLALSIISFVFAGQIVWTQSFNASADFDFDLSTYFLRFFSIEVVLYALSSVISSVLNAERDYFWSTAAPIVNNIVTTASFFGYALFAPTNPQLAILCLAIGNPLGVLVQVLCQLPSLKRCGVKLRLRVDLRDPCIRETIALGVPTLIVTLVSFATTSVQSSCSLSVNPNGAAITYYARMWYVLPYSIFAIPITTAMFTELSTYAANNQMPAFVQGLRRGSGHRRPPDHGPGRT